MLDRRLRRTVDPVLISAAAVLHRRGIGADAVTMAACLIGLTGAGLIAAGHPLLGLAGFLLGRLLDGLDGALARMTAPTDRGGFLDIVLDFLVYGAVPLAFAFLDPARNALAAAVLLASFLVNGIALMAFALMDERRGVATAEKGAKSFHFLAGLAEGTQTIAAVALFCLFPGTFAVLALAFASLCFASAAGRIILAYRQLGPRG